MDTIIGKKGVALLIVAIVALAIFAAGCTTPTPTTSANVTATPTTQKQMTIVDMVAGDPPSLDPHVEYDSATFGITQNVYETLAYYNGEDAKTPVGVLATSWDHNDNYTVWTFHLRNNVTFHDGTAFNASAVKYSFDRGVLLNNPDGCYSGLLTTFFKGGDEWMASNHTQADADAYLANQAVKVINDSTVQITLARPYPDWPYVVTFPGTAIVSPSFEKAHGGYTINGFANTTYKENMCGTGPFKFQSWTHEDRIVLVRNDNYWQTPAKASQVIVRNVPDYNTRLMALQNGEADIIYVPMKNYPQIKNLTGINYKIYNDTLTVNFIGMYEGKAPFNNSDVRKAFVESFDAQTYLANVSYGFGALPHGVVPKGLKGYNESIVSSPYNTTDAKLLLQKAGFSKDKPTTLVIAFNKGNTGRQTQALMLKSTIESYDLGITIDIQELTWGTLLDKQKKGDLDMFTLGWIADYPAADDFIGPFAASDVYFARQVKYKNDAVDALYKDSMTTTDPAKQVQDYDQIQAILMTDNPYIMVNQPPYWDVMSNKLKGYTHNVLDSQHIYYPMYKE